MNNKITHKEIEKVLGFSLNNDLKNIVDSYDLEYRSLSNEEYESYLLHVIDVLTSDITFSGKHRLTEWENGWTENLEEFKKSSSIENLIPKYHGKNRILRWNGNVVMPITENFDYKLHISFVDAVLQHYLKKFNTDNVFEFGCGPGYHLIRLSAYDRNLKLFGSDWTSSSQDIINNINNKLNLSITPFKFNFFEPDYNVHIPDNSAVYTVAALEQVGPDYVDFVDFLLKKKPSVCIHLEPIDELLDEKKVLDFLSIKYFRKRKYLKGFLPYLESLEKEGKIEIIRKDRTMNGSYFIEGHSLVVWRPL